MKKIVNFLAILIIAILVFSASPARLVQADDPVLCTTDCYVAPTGNDANLGNEDSPFKTIQKGIDTVSEGGTVHVATGTYQESKYGWADLVIDKSLTLIGQGRANSVVQFSQNGYQGLEINAPGGGALGPVRIEAMGFTRRPGNDWSADWAVRIGLGGGTFEKIEWVDSKIDYAKTRGLHFESAGTYQEVLIQNSGFLNNGVIGVSFQGITEKLTINNGNFNYNGELDPFHGYGLAFEGDVSNISVTGANFNSNTAQGINAARISNAVFDNINANDNRSTEAPYYQQYGFALNDWVHGSENILIKNSSFARNGWAGLLISAPDVDDQGHFIKNVEVTSSKFIGNDQAGISVWDVKDLQNLKIHHNRFWSVQALLGNQSVVVDAENNWYGYNTGPGDSYSKVTGSFDYNPWLVMKLDVTPMFLPGQDSTITADLTFNSDNVDTSSLGFVYPGQVSFTPTEYFDPDTDMLESSKAPSIFSAPPVILGSPPFDVCAQLENSWDKVCLPFPNFYIMIPLMGR